MASECCLIIWKPLSLTKWPVLAFLPGEIEVVMLKSGQFDVNIYPLNKEVLKLIRPQDVNSWRSHKSPREANFKFQRETSDPTVVNEELLKQGDDKEKFGLDHEHSWKKLSTHTEGSSSLSVLPSQCSSLCLVWIFIVLSERQCKDVDLDAAMAHLRCSKVSCLASAWSPGCVLEVFQQGGILARLGGLTEHETEVCEQLNQILNLSKPERWTPAQGLQFWSVWRVSVKIRVAQRWWLLLYRFVSVSLLWGTVLMQRLMGWGIFSNFFFLLRVWQGLMLRTVLDPLASLWSESFSGYPSLVTTGATKISVPHCQCLTSKLLDRKGLCGLWTVGHLFLGSLPIPSWPRSDPALSFGPAQGSSWSLQHGRALQHLQAHGAAAGEGFLNLHTTRLTLRATLSIVLGRSASPEAEALQSQGHPCPSGKGDSCCLWVPSVVWPLWSVNSTEMWLFSMTRNDF